MYTITGNSSPSASLTEVVHLERMRHHICIEIELLLNFYILLKTSIMQIGNAAKV
jgi:hypothetical protein